MPAGPDAESYGLSTELCTVILLHPHSLLQCMLLSPNADSHPHLHTMVVRLDTLPEHLHFARGGPTWIP